MSAEIKPTSSFLDVFGEALKLGTTIGMGKLFGTNSAASREAQLSQKYSKAAVAQERGIIPKVNSGISTANLTKYALIGGVSLLALIVLMKVLK
jgi:hypothetical protein